MHPILAVLIVLTPVAALVWAFFAWNARMERDAANPDIRHFEIESPRTPDQLKVNRRYNYTAGSHDRLPNESAEDFIGRVLAIEQQMQDEYFELITALPAA